MSAVLVNKLDTDGRIYAYYEEDLEGFLEENKQLRSLPQKSDWGRHVASIPNVIAMKWLNEEWNRGNAGLRYMSKEWEELIIRKLSDPEWAYLRTDGAANQSGWRAHDGSRATGV